MKFRDASAVLQLCLQEPQRRRLYGPAEANLRFSLPFIAPGICLLGEECSISGGVR